MRKWVQYCDENNLKKKKKKYKMDLLPSLATTLFPMHVFNCWLLWPGEYWAPWDLINTDYLHAPVRPASLSSHLYNDLLAIIYKLIISCCWSSSS